MEYPYMPLGESDNDKQKRSIIEQAINLIKVYEEDSDVQEAIMCLKKVIYKEQ